MTKAVVLATEDELSERVGERLLVDAGLKVELSLRRGGNGYLKSKIGDLCNMAKHKPVLLLTDLDQSPCPSLLKSTWLKKTPMPANMAFRIATREVEAWLLADHAGMQQFLCRSLPNLPTRPDSLSDPKRILLQLASRAPRKVRDELVAMRGAAASQGLGYNHCLSSFVRDLWDPNRAAALSPSLQRAQNDISRLRG